MAQTRTFSIYLLKEGYDATSALKEDSTLTPETANHLPDGASVLVLDSPARQPWWRSYFGIERDLRQAHKGALVFMPVDNRFFALTFGNVAHNLKDDAYEYDFGIRVTLNCVDPVKLKNTDTLDPGTARRRRTQHSIEADLTYFDFDHDSSVLKSITGKVKAEYEDLLRQATGASNLRVSSKLSAAELTALCARLLPLYEDDSYLASFPNIQKIIPIRDPSKVAALNNTLLRAIRSQSTGIHLSIPDLIDYSHNSDSLYVTFRGAGSGLLHSEASVTHYYTYLDAHGIQPSSLTLEDLKIHKLALTDEEGVQRRSYSVFKSLLFDTTLSGSSAAYHLNEGNWYEADHDYVEGLQARLDPYCSDLAFLADCSHRLEADYNAAIGEKLGFVCLDKTNVSPQGQSQIEPCDVYTVIGDHAVLVHVKISTGSSQLSHLFNQGANSVELLKSEDGTPARLIERLKGKRKDSDDMNVLRAPIESGTYKVVFAIITRKDPAAKSLNLPLFSRISLARSVRALDRVMGVPVEFGFIKNVSPKEPGKQKQRRSRKSKTSATKDTSR